ncbi:GNAT family N-acetyltransferase [Streptomyces vinaceus]|uniref:GNAT family N-acetyltransferase n=1 Tax=Streptomyces vinaceus TaxID=1960 RepID=UPI0036BFB800
MSSTGELVTHGSPLPDWDVQSLPPDQWQPFYAAVLGAFHEPEPDEVTALWGSLGEPRRCLVVRERGAIMGTAGTFSFRMSIPGGRVVDTAGVSMVSVQAVGRRRGVLTALMRQQLDSLRRGGEPLAVLTASEAPIYGRFGYGMAARQLSLDIASRRVRLAAPAVGSDEVGLSVEDPHKALDACEELYGRLLPQRPGMMAHENGWELVPLLDPPAWRDGSAPVECVIARMDGRVAGYARYSVAVEWSRTNTAEGTVRVRDIEADDPRAYAALWRFILETDLTSRVIAPNRPVDEALLHMVSDVRHCTPTVLDSLYVRLVDIPRALCARTYATAIDTVLEVGDRFAPWNQGRWRLTGDGEGAVCTRTHDAPDLSLDVAALGSAYLGGVTFSELAAAGRVHAHRPGILATATAAFSSASAPWMPFAFCRSLLPRL